MARELFEDRCVDSCESIRKLKNQDDGTHIVGKLMNYGIDISQGSKIKNLPRYLARKIAKQEALHVAVSGTGENMEELLDYGVDNDTLFYHNYEDRYLVDIAITSGNIHVVRVLAESGCNLLHTSKDGWDPLRLAFDRGYYDIATLLISDFGCNPFQICEKEGLSIFDLFFCSDQVTDPKTGNLIGFADGLLKAMLRHELAAHFINRRDRVGRTPIFNALVRSSPQIADILLDHGACVTLPPVTTGDTCLSLVMYLPKNKRIVRRVLETVLIDHRRVFGQHYESQFFIYIMTGLKSLGMLSIPQFLLHNHTMQLRNPDILNIFEEYFLHPFYIDRKFDDGNTMLLTAVRTLNYPMFVRILRSGARADIFDALQKDAILEASSQQIFARDTRFLTALLEVGAITRKRVKSLPRPKSYVKNKTAEEAMEMMETETNQVKSLKCLVRNSLRVNHFGRCSVMAQAKQKRLPKLCLDFLRFEDLRKGQDFVLEANYVKFPETMEDRTYMIHATFAS